MKNWRRLFGTSDAARRSARVMADSRRTDESTKRTDEALKTIDDELVRLRLRLIERRKERR